MHLEEPLPLPLDFLEAMARCVAAGVFDEADEEMLWFAKNETVQITTGVWAGHVGRFQRKIKGRAELLMSCLGRETAIQVPVHQLGRKAA
jgi:hypothetical protein